MVYLKGKIGAILFATTIDILACFSKVKANNRANYGEECNSTQLCSSKDWLTCREGICGCLVADLMLYNEESGKCVVKSGERCRYEIVGTGMVEVLNCIEHAVCDSKNGICVCHPGFYEVLDGLCEEERSYGEECSPNGCLKSAGLSCSDSSVCSCGTEGAWENSICVGLVEESCISGRCVRNAECNNDYTCKCKQNFYATDSKKCHEKQNIGGPCSKDNHCMYSSTNPLKCVEEICICDPLIAATSDWNSLYYRRQPTRCVGLPGKPCISSYCEKGARCNDRYAYPSICECEKGDEIPNPQGKCVRKPGGLCIRNDECTDGVVCVDGHCRCPYLIHQYFDSELARCLGFVGTPCSDNKNCTKNASCQPISSESSTSVCKCDEDRFTVDGTQQCALKYKASCSEAVGCNEGEGLRCINQICQCQSGMYEYSDNLGRCVGLLGADCSKIPCGPDMWCSDSLQSGIKLLDNKRICRCKANFFPSGFLKCSKKVKLITKETTLRSVQ